MKNQFLSQAEIELLHKEGFGDQIESIEQDAAQNPEEVRVFLSVVKRTHDGTVLTPEEAEEAEMSRRSGSNGGMTNLLVVCTILSTLYYMF